MRSSVETTAVHESGHAIVAIHFGIRFEGVELRVQVIDGFVHCGGRLKGSELPEDADNRRLQKELTVVMAGYAAQSLLAPTNGFSIAEFKFPDDRDFGAAIDVLSWMQPPVRDARAAEAAMSKAWLDARQLVAANWQRMGTIGDELVRRSHSNGKAIDCQILLSAKEIAQLLAAAKRK